MEDIIIAMDDDFNTPKAIAAVLKLIRNVNQNVLKKK